MTPEQYRKHRTLGGPFRSGELAGLACADPDSNPYRLRLGGRRHPRRGSWTEACIRAWTLGWREGMRQWNELHLRPEALASTEGAEC